MNTRFLSGLLGLLTVSGLILAGCAAPATPATPAPATSAPATEAVTEAATAATTDAATAATTEQASTGGVSFANDIQPLLTSRCLSCHGGERTQKGLDVSSYDSLMAGSQDGAVVVPGDAANSPIVNLVQSGKMPKRGPKLTPDQVQLLVDWINAGAANN
jgi:uncharacterized membrane protein